MAIEVVTFKLRGGQPTAVMGSCTGVGIPSEFVMQTFGVERLVSVIDDAAVQFVRSSDMQGQKPGNHDDPAYRATTYSSAQYQSRGVLTTDGDLAYNSTLTQVAEYLEDSEIEG